MECRNKINRELHSRLHYSIQLSPPKPRDPGAYRRAAARRHPDS